MYIIAPQHNQMSKSHTSEWCGMTAVFIPRTNLGSSWEYRQ